MRVFPQPFQIEGLCRFLEDFWVQRLQRIVAAHQLFREIFQGLCAVQSAQDIRHLCRVGRDQIDAANHVLVDLRNAVRRDHRGQRQALRLKLQVFRGLAPVAVPRRFIDRGQTAIGVLAL